MNPAGGRESPVPLYQQLVDVLHQDTAGGWLPAGVAFLSERKLMACHQVTRAAGGSCTGRGGKSRGRDPIQIRDQADPAAWLLSGQELPRRK